jgi:hypothetical protein
MLYAQRILSAVTGRWLRLAAMTAYMCILGGDACLAQWQIPDRRVTINVSNFLGDALAAESRNLGRGVAAVIGSQIYSGLRHDPRFRRARVGLLPTVDAAQNTDPSDLVVAITRGVENVPPADRPHIVVWGRFFQISGAIVVMGNVSVFAHDHDREDPLLQGLWTVSIETARGTTSYQVGLPARVYSFEPIVLPESVVASYQHPEYPPIYADRTGGGRIDRTGLLEVVIDSEYVRGLEAQGDLLTDAYPVLLRWRRSSLARRGWIRTNDLRDLPNQMSLFAGALARLYRGDMERSERSIVELLQKVDLPAALRRDLLLLLARVRADYRRGGSRQRSCSSSTAGARLDNPIETAIESHPDNSIVRRYAVMCALAELGPYQSPHRRERLDRLEARVNELAGLSSAEDQLVRFVRTQLLHSPRR